IKQEAVSRPVRQACGFILICKLNDRRIGILYCAVISWVSPLHMTAAILCEHCTKALLSRYTTCCWRLKNRARAREKHVLSEAARAAPPGVRLWLMYSAS